MYQEFLFILNHAINSLSVKDNRKLNTRTTADGSSVYFVTQDKAWDGSRGWTIRRYDVRDNLIETIGEVASIDSGIAADKRAQELAGPGCVAERVAFSPASSLDDFERTLEAHGVNSRQSNGGSYAKRMMREARRHHELMEIECNEGALRKPSGEPFPRLQRVLDKIKELAAEMGAAGVVFSGDPRGCTVKLVMPDGYTDDWSREGVCVPHDR